jgi:hypothetical protein
MATFLTTTTYAPNLATMGGTHVAGPIVAIAHDACDPQIYREGGALADDNVRSWTPVLGGSHPCHVCGAPVA